VLSKTSTSSEMSSYWLLKFKSPIRAEMSTQNFFCPLSHIAMNRFLRKRFIALGIRRYMRIKWWLMSLTYLNSMLAKMKTTLYLTLIVTLIVTFIGPHIMLRQVVWSRWHSVICNKIIILIKLVGVCSLLRNHVLVTLLSPLSTRSILNDYLLMTRRLLLRLQQP